MFISNLIRQTIAYCQEDTEEEAAFSLLFRHLLLHIAHNLLVGGKLHARPALHIYLCSYNGLLLDIRPEGRGCGLLYDDKVLLGFLPAECGRLARAWEVGYDTLARSLSHILLAERGNCEGVTLNCPPINDKG